MLRLVGVAGALIASGAVGAGTTGGVVGGGGGVSGGVSGGGGVPPGKSSKLLIGPFFGMEGGGLAASISCCRARLNSSGLVSRARRAASALVALTPSFARFL